MKQRNSIKKSMVMLLVFAMLVSMLSACGSKSEDEGSTATTTDTKTTEGKSDDATAESQEPAVKLGDNPMEVTMLYSDNANYPAQSDWMILEEIKNRLNVDLTLESVPESDYEARRTVVFNSGEMPDIISKTFATDISAYIASEQFLPISDYYDQMPNFTAFADKYNYWPDLELSREADGKIYFMPVNGNTQRVVAHGWMIRMDQLEEYNIEQPTTMDEVYEACKIWKEHNPESYPITNRFGMNNILSKFAPAFDTIAGWGLGNMFMYVEEDDNFIFAPTTDEYKEMLMWTNKMYTDGLLDEEFSTLDSTLYEERAKNGEQFIMVDWIGNENRYNRDGPEQSGNANFDIQPIMPPMGPRGTYSGSQVSMYEQSWVISASVAEREDFPEFIQFLDWFYSDEAATLTTFGIEGESYEVLEDGRKEYIDLNADYTADLGISQNSLTVRRDDDWFASRKTQYVVDLFTEMNEKGVFTPKQPSIVLSDMEKEEEGFYTSTLKDYINQKTGEFIYGVDSFDNWDAFIEECEAKGMKELDTLYNGAWDAQK